ncbi:MAG TPA: hypothetical protein VKS25_07750, partial [Solirubrobacteraceae bacterium]|nr:hypothetical protein [Solirubrobacteraceae bacterium]
MSTTREALDRAVRDQEARVRTPRVKLGFEPLTYRRGGDQSWVADCWRAKRMNDPKAAERLDRHAAEMRVELEAKERRSTTTVPDGVSVKFESRAVDLTPGMGGYSVPPLWLIEQTATAPRPSRILARLIPSLPLKVGVVSVSAPRIVTGTSTAVTPPEGVVSDTDVTDAAVSSQVVQISGHADVALQLIEQSGRGGASFDEVVWRDLLSSYDATLDAQLVAGTGTGVGPYQQLPGLATITGAGNTTYTDASPTASEMWPSFGKAYATVSNTRKVVAECWLMRGGRWAW